MDIKKLAGALLSSESVNGLSSLSGVSDNDVTNVLTQALPALLDGAKGQAKDENTAESFAGALADHAKADTGNLTKFLGNVDLKDGAKIIGHLLGSSENDTIEKVAKQAGVSNDKTSTILSAAAPLLMSLLGQQADEDADKDSGVGALVGALLENVDVTDLLTGLLTDNSDSSNEKRKKKKKKSDSKNDSGNLLGTILKSLLK